MTTVTAPKKKVKVRRKMTMANRRIEVGDLYLNGKTQPYIAKTLGVSQPTISRDLEAIHAIWQEQATDYYSQAMAQELAKIDNLERVYWEAWEASKKEPETTETEHQRSSVVEPEAMANFSIPMSMTLSKRRSPTGDKRFLEGVQWCIDKRIKLMGLAPPEQIKVSWEKHLPKDLQGEKEELQRQFAMLLVKAAQEKQSEVE